MAVMACVAVLMRLRTSCASTPKRSWNASAPRSAPQLLALVGKFSDGIGDGVVQATVKCPKLVHLDRRVLFDCQIGDGLAQIAIIVNHEVDRVPALQ